MRDLADRTVPMYPNQKIGQSVKIQYGNIRMEAQPVDHDPIGPACHNDQTVPKAWAKKPEDSKLGAT